MMPQRLLFLLLLWLTSYPAWGHSVDLAGINNQAHLLSLDQAVWLLEDRQGTQKADKILDATDWQAANKASLNIGLSRSVFWLKLQVTNHAAHPVTRWFSLGSPRIQDIRFYQLDPHQRRIAFYQGGSNYPIHLRPIVSGLNNVFDVTLQPGETHTLLIRASSDTSINLTPEIWTPVAYREYESKQKVTDLIFMFVILTIGLYLFTTGLIRRDWVMLTMGGWLVFNSLYELSFFGYAHEYLLPQGGLVVGALPVTMALIGVIFMFQFLYVALQAKHSPFWRVFLLGSSFMFAFIIGLAYVGGLYEAILISNNTIFIYILLYPLLILLRLKHRQRHSEAFLVAAMIFFILISHRILYVLGLFNEPLHAYGLLWSLLLIGLALSLLVGFTTRSVALYREQIQHQNQLIEYQKQAQNALEQAVERRTKELEQAIINADEANRAKSDFLARVSHDLKSPLTSILGYSELICAQEAPSAADKSQVIYRSAQRLLNLVNDLIEYATGDKNPDKLHNRPIYSASFFNSIAEEARLLAEINHNQFDCTLNGTLPGLIEIDSKRLHQVLINLLSNACKFTQKGRVEFVIDVQPLNAHQCRLVFHIRDNGCGIEPTQLDVIFQPFKRLAHHRAIEGLGLGLAIAKHWADQMGAQLKAHSQPNQGTEMILRLDVPIVTERALDNAQLFIDNHAMPELQGNGRRLWIIEDTPAILKLLTTELEGLGFDVCAMADAQTAFEAISRPANPQPDLIITDYHLPNANGQVILDAARRRWPTQRAILISAAYGVAKQEQQAQAFDAVLSKPIELAKLRQTLIQLLHADNPPTEQPVLTLAQHIQQALSASEWQALQQMIECYAVTDVIDWAERYQSQHPQHRAWLHRLKQLARDSEITQLQALINEKTS